MGHPYPAPRTLAGKKEARLPGDKGKCWAQVILEKELGVTLGCPKEEPLAICEHYKIK